jgi:hypothetical protein
LASPYFPSGNNGAVMMRLTRLNLTQTECEDPASFGGPLFKVEAGHATIVRAR